MKNIFLIIGISFVLIGCNGEQVKIELGRLAELKKSLLIASTSFNASEASQMQTQPFFDETVSLVAQLSDQEKPVDMMSGLFWEMSVDDFCKKNILAKADWEQINSKCKSSLGYLCGEEVRALPNIYQKLFSLASSELSSKFKSTPICKEWR